jgi:hypothetical protein
MGIPFSRIPGYTALIDYFIISSNFVSGRFIGFSLDCYHNYTRTMFRIFIFNVSNESFLHFT